MIATVTLNLALDITYHVPEVSWHAANRVTSVAQRAGGKGVNVARVLHALGRETLVCGLVGGPTGETVRAELDRSGLPARLTPIAQETRRTVAVVDSARGDATGFWEPGPVVAESEWNAFVAAYDDVLAAADVVVLSGSLPRGVPSDAYAELCRRAGRRAIETILDADGDALRLGLAGQPTLVKPNRDELARAGGTTDVLEAANALRTAGAQNVVVSQGPDGLLALTPDGAWQARPPATVEGNPTGAGDAAVAALAHALMAATPWPARLLDAAALSAAAVAAPLAGSFDPDVYRAHLQTGRVEPLSTTTDPPGNAHAAHSHR